MLQFNDLRVDQRKELCIRVNTRKLNRELYTELSILYSSMMVCATTSLAYPK